MSGRVSRQDGAYKEASVTQSLFDHVDPLQRRADEIARADLAEDVNLDLQRVYSGLMTVEEFEHMYA